MRATWRAAGVLLTTIAVAVALPRAGRAHGSITTTVLFDREIVGLLERRCVSCHVEGGLSFPLSTYEQTWVRRLSMHTEVLRRHMPPWAAVPGYGEFANDNGLTPREAQFLVSWVEGLGPRNGGTTFLNVPAAVQPPAPVRARARAGGWQSGQPDLEWMLQSGPIPAGGPVVRRVTIDPRLAAPERIRALEFLPGDRRRLRAVRFTVESTGQWLGGWSPWYAVSRLPEGVVFELPAGARVAAELHYGPGIELVGPVGTLGLFRARTAAARATDLVVTANRVPGRADLRRGTARLAAETTLWALAPEVPAGTRSLEVSARRLDGSTQVLLLVEQPFEEWPTPYVFKSPVRLPRGTELRFALELETRPATPPRLVVSRYGRPAG